MKQLFILIALCYTFISYGQVKKDRILYGKITTDSLLQAPYDKWYKEGYDTYTVNPFVQSQFNNSMLKGITVEAFFGSWCGDSKRELPHMIKLLDRIGFDKKNLIIIATGGSDSLYKQSPQGEEKGKGIFRVPVFIVYKNGKEINRINEFPVQSLERDLLSIVKNESYSPNYKSFSTVNQWINEGILADTNVSVRGLAMQVKPMVNNEHELNSLAYLLLKQDQKKKRWRFSGSMPTCIPNRPMYCQVLVKVTWKTAIK
ncbi:MAG: thioredoxin family protein [Ferruginibacter sp.]